MKVEKGFVQEGASQRVEAESGLKEVSFEV